MSSHPHQRAPALLLLRLGAVLGIVAVAVLGWGPGATAPARAAASVVPCLLPESAQPRVDRALEELAEDPVLLEDGAVPLDQDQRDRLRESVRRAPGTLWVAALTGLPEAAEPEQVACALANAAPAPVSVAVLLGPDRFPALGGDTTYDPEADEPAAMYLAVQADLDETGSEAERLVLIVDRASGRAALPSDGGRSGATPTAQEPDATTRSGRGLVLGIGGVAVALVLAVVVLRVARRRGGGRRTRRLLDAVRRGRSTGAEIATRRAVRELGDRLDRLEIDRRDDPGAWQRALDAYDTASRRLDRAGARADLDEMQRLCREGEVELDTVEQHRTGRSPS